MHMHSHSHMYSRSPACRRLSSLHHGVGTPGDAIPAQFRPPPGHEREQQIRIARTLLAHVWRSPGPDAPEEEREHAARMKRRVLASLGLMVGGKGVTIQVPFVFKALVDSLPLQVPPATRIVVLQLALFLACCTTWSSVHLLARPR